MVKDAKRLKKLAGKSGDEDDQDNAGQGGNDEGDEERGYQNADDDELGLMDGEEFASEDEEINSDEC